MEGLGKQYKDVALWMKVKGRDSTAMKRKVYPLGRQISDPVTLLHGEMSGF